MIGIAGHRVVVVGGTSGMGLATVRAAAVAGAQVVAAGRRPLANRRGMSGDRQVEVDVTDEQSVRALFEGVGRLDHLLVTASPGSAGAFLEQDLTAARTVMDGRFFGSWLCARYAAPRLADRLDHLRDRRCSRAAAYPRLHDHCRVRRPRSARPGAGGRARTPPGQHHPPGLHGQQFLSDVERADLRRRVAGAMPVGRMGSPDDVADAAVFLMTNPQVTGAVLEVTGGETLVNTLEVAMILVTGATGNVGGELVQALARRGEPTRALARDPARTAFPATVEVAAGDLEAPESLGAALTGIRSVFLLGGFASLPDVLRRVRAAGAERVALLTSRCVVGGRPDNAITARWLESEAAVMDCGLQWTLLRPSGFHSNALRWLPQLQRGDVVRAPWPHVPIASIDPADIAAVAATVLTDADRPNAAVSLSGPQPLTPSEQVATLARVLRRPLWYEPLSDADARDQLAADSPPEIVEAFFRFFSDGEFDDSVIEPTVAELTGRPPRTFEQWATAHLQRFPRTARPEET